jgi:4-alpha-glucanotransferase
VRRVPDESLLAILELIRKDDRPQLGDVVPPVLVAWNGKWPAMVAFPEYLRAAKIKCRIRLEDGQEFHTVLPGAAYGSVGNFARSFHQTFAKGKLPFGYHHVYVETPQTVFETLLISSPKHSYSASATMDERGRTRKEPQAKLNELRKLYELHRKAREEMRGMFVPLYAVHSRRSWGAGNFTDLAELGDWAVGQGARVLCTLPLMSGFLEGSIRDPSPYSPISRLFWNEFYVDIERLPEFDSCKAAQRKFRSAGFQKRLQAARRSEWVDYGSGMRLRREILELLAAAANQGRLETFARENPLVREYARFRAVCGRLDRPWQEWPGRLRGGKIQAGDFSPKDERYHLYCQWAAQRQIEQVIADLRDRGQKLYLDLPVGVNRHGFDVWRNQDLFVSEVNVGAPPDMFFSKGQNWGFPPMNPRALRQSGYRHVIEYLRSQMGHAGMLRIDHVMGLHRLYWIPPGFSARDGTYVRYPAEELHAILCLESHRNRCEIVGENLGNVPQEVNRAMDKHRYRKMYVVQFEQRPGKRPLKTPPKKCVAMLDTHDTPTFAAYWRGLDIYLRVKLGLLNRAEAKSERANRKKVDADTARFLVKRGFLKTERAGTNAVMRALLAWLREKGVGMALTSLEDLWCETRPQNVPGVWREYRNWRRKCAFSLERIQERPPLLSNG